MKKYKKFYRVLFLIIFSLALFFIINSKINFNFKIKDHFFNISKIYNEFLLFKDYKHIYNENKDLNIKLMEYENNNLKVLELEKEILELKSALGLKKVYSLYELIYSTIIMNDKMYFQNIITIDKGLNDGLETGDAVIANGGLIGVINDAFDNSSTVKLYNGKDVNISIKVSSSKENIYGSVTEFNDGFYLIKDINNYDNVKLGDKVVTTGMGNLPSGILLGTVKEIKQDSFGISNILYVSNDIDFNNIKYVAVLKEDK